MHFNILSTAKVHIRMGEGEKEKEEWVSNYNILSTAHKKRRKYSKTPDERLLLTANILKQDQNT